MYRYYVGDKEITEAEAKETENRNKELWKLFEATADWTHLQDIQFILKEAIL